MKKIVYWVLFVTLLTSCTMKERVDLLLFNGVVYSVDDNFNSYSAVAVKAGKIFDLGESNTLKERYSAKKEIDLKGAPLYPGFNDAHGHLTMLGQGLSRVDLRGASSFEELIERLQERYQESAPTYLAGDGWDQTAWEGGRFPSNQRLNELFPDIPVVLFRIDFHAVIVNQKAIDLLGITPGDPSIPEGEALLEEGEFRGVFLEGMADRFESILPEPNEKELEQMILVAQEAALSQGLTSITNAGGSVEAVKAFERLNERGKLKLRINLMLTPQKENLERFTAPWRDKRLTIGTIKLFADGALGSRGALMIEPYSDKEETKGISVITQEEFDSRCQWAIDHNFQVAIHAIGDGANRQALNTYSKFLERGNDRRWRVEHSQIIHPDDFSLFGEYSIIPSVQPTHATSDMGWAATRVGERIKGAYAYKELLNQNGWLPSGTDFPIEEVNPIYTFFAAHFRQNLNFLPEEGFQMENSLTREEALRSMTIWAAKASFEEESKGSIEIGKVADFVVLDGDIMKLPAVEVVKVKPLYTFVEGELLYESLLP